MKKIIQHKKHRIYTLYIIFFALLFTIIIHNLFYYMLSDSWFEKILLVLTFSILIFLLGYMIILVIVLYHERIGKHKKKMN